MARTRAVPRRRPNINFQQRGNIDFERQRVAATRNISSSESSSTASSAAATPTRSPARSPTVAIPARSHARSPLGNLARNLANGIGRNIVRSLPVSPPASPIARPRRRIRRRINSESSSASSSANNQRRSLSTTIKRRRIRTHDVKIKFVLPRVKDVEVKHNGRVVRKMKVRRVAKHTAKKRNVRYG